MQDAHSHPDDRRRSPRSAPDRRADPRLPEELTAVITDSYVASALFDQLPADQRRQEADWVAAGTDRDGRARRAVEVVRHALRGKSPG